MNPAFKHFDLKLISPPFAHPLTDSIIELDYLRKKELGGSTHPKIFFQLKNLFHTLESIGSARIEGNRTTIAEFIETKIEPKEHVDESIQEILNMEEGMNFIDQHVKDYPVNRAFISELHKYVVANLSTSREGDPTPGMYRTRNVKIRGSEHLPPDVSQVPSYMDELFKFINRKDGSKYDLLKTVIAHHRFVWIHPFQNGNGRTVRLFTYAMLVKQGFNIDQGRIVNPTAVFCHDRREYCENLSIADKGDDASMIIWCEYVLSGLKREIEKIDRLLNYDYLKEKIMIPAVEFSLERKLITEAESKILKIAVQKQVFQAADLKTSFPGKLSAEISRMIRRLRERKMIISEKKDTRKYLLSFQNNYLLRGVIDALDKNGFLPIKEEPIAR